MLKECEECGGNGEVEVEHCSPMSFTASYGDIYVTWEVCEVCDGSGEIEIEEEID